MLFIARLSFTTKLSTVNFTACESNQNKTGIEALGHDIANLRQSRSNLSYNLQRVAGNCRQSRVYRLNALNINPLIRSMAGGRGPQW